MEHTSLDGVIQHENDENFRYGDWTTPFRSPAGLSLVLQAQGSDFDLLLGRRTYDAWSQYWPKAGDTPMANALNKAVKHVLTHRPESLAWNPAKSLGSDPVARIQALKATEGPDLLLWGSSTLTALLFESGLVDELILLVYPVLLGQGKRYFSNSVEPRELALISSHATPTGVLVNTYRYVGPLNI